MDKNYQKLLAEYHQLEQDLLDPSVINDPKKLSEKSQRFGQISADVQKINRLQELEKLIAKAKNEISQETDPDLISIAQQELRDYETEKNNLTSEINASLKPTDPNDKKNVIMEIRAGTGGEESALFAADLFRMYSKFAEKNTWKIHLLAANRSDIGGFKEIIFEVIGANVFQTLKYESGTHRVQRVPETEKSGRVHTSAATVAVLPEAEEIDLHIDQKDLKIDVYRAGGHGGQSVNKTESAVRITYLPTNTVVACQDERSQQQNKFKAMQILRSRILADMQSNQRQKITESRKKQIGSGDRSEKIRTYNFPQDRITDHRIKKSWHNLKEIMDGELTEVIAASKEVGI